MKRIFEFKEQLSLIPRTQFPTLDSEMEATLNTWAHTKKSGKTGHEIIEKFLTIIDDYKFDQGYSKTLKNNQFQIRTVDGRLIEIHFRYGDLDDFPMIIITDGNLVREFDIENFDNQLFIDLKSHKELDTNFVQSYYCSNERFHKIVGEKRIIFDLGKKGPKLSEPTEEDEKFKEEFKKTNFEDIMDAFHFLIERMPTLTSFEIEFTKSTWETIDKIKVKNGLIREVQFTKQLGENKLVIHEELNTPEEIEALLAELDAIKNSQDTIRRMLKQNNEQ